MFRFGPLFARRLAPWVLLLGLAAPRGAAATPERVWSQERVVLSPDGQPLEPLRVRAEHLSGLEAHSFPLSASATLVVRTNAPRPLERGLAALAACVGRAWEHTHRRLGLAPRGDVLLYLIEVDRVPEAYRFEAEGSLDSRFGEVRLAWIPNAVPLWGDQMPEALAELVFDTLPHEFVHDQLDQVTPLRQELSRGPSPRTRWFVEGLCEVVAKEFCRAESPATWARLVRLRRLDQSGRLLHTVDSLLEWTQAGTRPQRESDLYGASMLLVRVWTDRVDPREILRTIAASEREVGGDRLLELLLAAAQCETAEALARAEARATATLKLVENEEARASERAGLLAR